MALLPVHSKVASTESKFLNFFNIMLDMRGKVDAFATGFDPSSVWKNVAAAVEEKIPEDLFSNVAQQFMSAERKVADSLSSTVEGLKSGIVDVTSPVRSMALAESVSEGLQNAFISVVDELKEMFPAPSQAPGHAQRQETVSRILGKTGDALTGLMQKAGASEEHLKHAQSALDAMKPIIETMLVIPGEYGPKLDDLEARRGDLAAGDLNEQHPHLRNALLITTTAMLTEAQLEVWILRTLLNLLGFGALGPVHGAILPRAHLAYYLLHLPV